MEQSVLEFYDSLSEDYHLIFRDWQESVRRQGQILDSMIKVLLPDAQTVLDCACGIGTQAIGLALQGYTVHATDLSAKAVERARHEAQNFGVNITFGVADFRTLSQQVDGLFDVVIACDNSLPHLLDDDDLLTALRNMRQMLRPEGLLLLSIRDYDQLLQDKTHSTPLTDIEGKDGRRITFQVWDWAEDRPIYTVQHFILKQTASGWLTAHRATTYRALKRDELTALLHEAQFSRISWTMPEDSTYYQPIVTSHA